MLSDGIYDLSKLIEEDTEGYAILSAILTGKLANDITGDSNTISFSLIMSMVEDDTTTFSSYILNKKISVSNKDIKYYSDIFILNPENKIYGNSIQIAQVLNRTSVLCDTKVFYYNKQMYITGSVIRIIDDNDSSNYIDIIAPGSKNFVLPNYIDCRHSKYYQNPSESKYGPYPFGVIKITCNMELYEYTPYEITPD